MNQKLSLLTMSNQQQLTSKEALAAMVDFLEKYYERTGSNDIACILSDLKILDDGKTADPAAWNDWMESIKKSKI